MAMRLDMPHQAYLRPLLNSWFEGRRTSAQLDAKLTISVSLRLTPVSEFYFLFHGER